MATKKATPRKAARKPKKARRLTIEERAERALNEVLAKIRRDEDSGLLFVSPAVPPIGGLAAICRNAGRLRRMLEENAMIAPDVWRTVDDLICAIENDANALGRGR